MSKTAGKRLGLVSPITGVGTLALEKRTSEQSSIHCESAHGNVDQREGTVVVNRGRRDRHVLCESRLAQSWMLVRL